MFLRTMFAFLALAFAAEIAQAQWRPTNGPGGSQIESLLSYNGGLYACTHGNGIFVTYNNGESWQAINNGLTNFKVETIIASTSALFIGTDGSGVFRSTNNGQSWTPVNNGITTPYIYTLAYVNGLLFAGAWPGANSYTTSRLFRSSDDGQSWQQISNPLSNYFYSLTVSNGKLYWGSFLNVFESVDFNQQWRQIGRGEIGYDVTSVVAGNDLFVGTIGYGVLRSSAGLQEWTDYNTSLVGKQVFDLVLVNNSLYAATEQGVFSRQLSEPNWFWVSGGLSDFVVFCLARHNGFLYAGTKSGIVQASNGTGLSLITTSAASYASTVVSSNMIAAMFGNELAPQTISATTLPLPTELAGTRVSIRDYKGFEYLAPLFFVSPTQINYLLPAGLSDGALAITVIRADGSRQIGLGYSQRTEPGLFSANSNGKDAAAALHFQIKANGTQVYNPIVRWDASQQRFLPIPIALGTAGDRDFLILFGTGVRAASRVFATVRNSAGTNFSITPTFYGAVAELAGLDQINLPLSVALRGQGNCQVFLQADGRASNSLTFQIN